ncbi:virulence factor family protein [Rhizobium lemnae]|uniref:Virulence factor family protein n=1 Tax=Rhizobium lemnae TaxID=1214924 RepID=A0ABV8EAS8_9HYPH|nr:AcvB/VirJ family lysyl-phosphatidylglycerol hydrolase [Rhizobium lemnae]MCJ8506378.1 virulence factor family protein [Rhizobium lemnae]
MRSILKTVAMGTFLLAQGLAVPAMAQRFDVNKFDTGMIPSPHILMPQGEVKASIFLLSDENGWNADEDKQAEALTEKGAIVIGIDLPTYITSLGQDPEDCIYMISDIESLAQQVQRSLGNGSYKTPIIAGIGTGATYVLGMMSQSPPATIGEAVAVDPGSAIALPKVLCTPAEKTTMAGGIQYGMSDGALPAPTSIFLTKSATADGTAHAQSLKKEQPDIDIEQSDRSAQETLIQALSDRIDAASQDNSPLGLPLTILDTKPTLNTMAIIISGDGGWRDIDADLGDALQEDGIPVVGLDSLRYFWSKKDAASTAADLSRIIRAYRKQWGVQNVLLIGYSFGADLLPSTYNQLPEADRSRVVMLSLLALSNSAEFEISVSGWLGASGSGEGGNPTVDLEKIDPKKVQCVYGTEDDEDACKALASRGIETIGIAGGHHFDEDYEALAKKIVASLKKRINS